MNQFTIQPGVMGSDNVLRGSMSDMDLFDAFCWLDNGQDLYCVEPIGDKVVINRQAEKKTEVGKVGVDVLAQRAADGVDIWTGEKLVENNEETNELDDLQ